MNNASKDIQDLLSTMRKRFNLPEVEPKELTRDEYEQKQVDFYNGSEGNLADIDGYNCTLCHNKGDIQYIKNGYVYTKSCSCMDTRKAISNMKKSGLENIIRDYTFDRFEAKEDWQKDMKDKAHAYLKDEEHNWFFIGGNPGAGKTHICTAISREFLLKGEKVKYMLWKEESTLLKAVINEPEVYTSRIEKLKQVDILYIDDFLKPLKSKEGNITPPTTADVNLAFEILDYRKNANLRTIISSERFIGEIIGIDEATGSRILEKTKNKYFINIKRDKSRNHRLASFVFDVV